jgi:hypothetical protein
MGYIISQEKILTKSKKNNNLTKLHTSHAASTTPTAAPTRITVGAFLLPVRNCVRFAARGNKRRWFVTSSQSSSRFQFTEQKSRFAARGAEILKKGFTDVLK